MAQEWAIRIGEHETQIQDLPVAVLADISKRTEVSWLMLQAAPLVDLTAAQALLKHVCTQEGAEVPQNLTGRTLARYFVQVEDSPNGDVHTSPAPSPADGVGE